ncbi:toll/interleukin-1 receptor domain-containing protein, partial [Trinickia mobilis]|uniref:toll/interleukin-1 receptor domain-containing protein n=1 Tax=Trinickia mobilis TaxID=2816356 RepID=UPI001F5E0393
MSRIFISHSSANNALALAIGRWLADNGWDDYFLDLEPAKGLAPGERWQEALRAAADHCEAVLFLISPAWRDSPWCLTEFLLAKQLGKTIFGLLVETVPLDALQKEMTAEWQLCDLVAGAQRQSFRVWHDPLVPETEVSFADAGLSRLKLGLRRAGLDPSSFPWPPPDNGARLTGAEALLHRSDFERLLGADGLSYLRACRGREEVARAERESQLQQIAEEQAHVKEEQARTGRAQRRIQILMGVIAFILIVTGGWIIHQTRAVARQTSLVLASAATTANDTGIYDRGMRFAMLAMGKSWRSPGSVEAELELMRGAHASMQIALLSGHQEPVDSAVFSPDGKRVVTASWDRTARVWDAATGKQIALLSGHQGWVYSATFSPGGQRVVTASRDRTARVWDAATGKQIVQLSGDQGWVYSAAFSPDGRRVVTASADRTARVWDAATGQVIARLTGHQGLVSSAAFSPD